MEIEFLGEKTVAQLVERGLVEDLADFYKLVKEDPTRPRGLRRQIR